MTFKPAGPQLATQDFSRPYPTHEQTLKLLAYVDGNTELAAQQLWLDEFGSMVVCRAIVEQAKRA